MAGDMDAFSSKEMREEFHWLAAPGHENLILNMTSIEFVDFSGIRALLYLYKLLHEKDSKLILVIDKPDILKMFRVMGLDKLFTIARSRESAVAKLAAKSSMII